MADTNAIKADLQANMPRKEIAAKHGVSTAYIAKLARKMAEAPAAPTELSAAVAPGHTDMMVTPESIEDLTQGLTDEEILTKVWDFSEQDREQIHYGVVDMGNTLSCVAECYQTTPEVIIKVVEIVKRQREMRQ